MKHHPGYYTVEKTATGRLLDDAKLYRLLGEERADSIWGQASGAYARAARGKVELFDLHARPERLLMSIELPNFRANRAVWGMAHHWDY